MKRIVMSILLEADIMSDLFIQNEKTLSASIDNS
jgi:hypothetical protein